MQEYKKACASTTIAAAGLMYCSFAECALTADAAAAAKSEDLSPSLVTQIPGRVVNTYGQPVKDPDQY